MFAGNAIQSFGYGAEGGALPATEPTPTFLPPAQPPVISRPAPSLHGIKPVDGACVFSTCANLQVSDSGKHRKHSCNRAEDGPEPFRISPALQDWVIQA